MPFWKPTLRIGLALASAAALAGLVFWWLFPTPCFAQPTGPYAIGTRTYAWTDHLRPEPFTSDRNDPRTLIVQIWYPASTTAGTPEAYLDNAPAIAALAARLNIPTFALRNLRYAPTHAFRDAEPAAGRFPVLLNPTGFSGFRTASLFWIEELVSHGYIVIGLDQPGTSAATTMPDGRVISVMIDKAEFDRFMPLALDKAGSHMPEMNGVALPGGIVPFLASDLSFVLDQVESLNENDPKLAGHFDLDRIGVFGMSLGGYVGPEACRADKRFRACLVADAGQTSVVAEGGLSQPVMIMTREAEVMRQERAQAGGWPEPEIARTLGSQRALFENNRADSIYLTMNRMFHINWTDAPIWSPIADWLGLSGPVDPYEGFAQVNALSLAFFNRYLKGKDWNVSNAAKAFDGITLEIRYAHP